MTMTGVYFSGTGNTRHCVEKLLGLLDQNGRAFSMEDPEAKSAIVGEDAILFAYPIQYSNLPVMVRDFITQNDVKLLKRPLEKTGPLFRLRTGKSRSGPSASGKGSTRCTMCYRCISACPAQAITLLGKTVVEQGGYEKYV